MFWSKKTGGAVSYDHGSDVREKYNSGVGFLQVGNIEKAMRIFEDLSEKDHPSAIYNLALLYAHGHGPRLMLREAPELFGKAAELGHEGAARYYAHFIQYQRGFQPEEGTGASKMFKLTGDGSCPVLLIHSVAADIILRMERAEDAKIYAIMEYMSISRSSEKGELFCDFLDYDIEDLNEAFKDLDEGSFERATPVIMSRNIGSKLQACVSEQGMPGYQSLFVRCSVLGVVSKAFDIIGPIDLPPIEFYK